MDDKEFAKISDVPTHALTFSLTPILSARRIHIIVPGAFKAESVRKTLDLPVSEANPASGLRLPNVLPNVRIYLDKAAASLSLVAQATKVDLVFQISEDLPVRAEKFKFNLTKILADNPDQIFFIGIETNIGESQKSQIMPIYKAIDEIRDLKSADGKDLFPNLIVRRAKAKDLVSTVKDLNKIGKLKFNNAFIGARRVSVDSKIYDPIGEGKAWISAIDDSNAGDYLPVFEAITLNMMAYLNADVTAIKNFYDAISDKPIDPAVLQEMIRNKIIYILPKAAKFDAKQLRALYELAHQVYTAA